MSAAGWLIDKSALVRLADAVDADGWLMTLGRGLVCISTPTLLEVGFSARNRQEWERSFDVPPVTLMPTVYLTPQAEDRAIEVQGLLASRGLHRAPSAPDLLVAAIAEAAGLTVLHIDKDFELISEVTGQPVERLRIAA